MDITDNLTLKSLIYNNPDGRSSIYLTNVLLLDWSGFESEINVSICKNNNPIVKNIYSTIYFIRA